VIAAIAALLHSSLLAARRYAARWLLEIVGIVFAGFPASWDVIPDGRN